MKYFASTTRIFLFLILCTAADAGAAVLQGKVTDAVEANVLTVQDGNRFYKIRLITITPPKGRHPLAEVARQHLADLTRDKFVTVKPVGLEQDGTVTGFVFYEGNDVGVQMVRDGAAWYDGSQGGRLNESARLLYEQSEQAARNEKRGVWQESLTARAAAAGSREKKIAAPHPAAPQSAARAKTLSPAEKARQLDAAYYLIKRRQEGAALPLLMQAVQLDPANADVHKNLCIVFSVTPQLGEALARCREAIRLRPDFDKAYQVSGYTLHRMGRKEEAFKAYRQALRLNPQYAKAHHNLGYLLLDTGHYREAVSAFLQAEKFGFEDPARLHAHLGTALYQLGRKEEARERWRRILTIGTPDEVREARAALRLP